jgi:hypothetical protein
MTDPGDDGAFATEVAAIGDVLKSLSALSGPARERVVEYVTRALNIRLEKAPPSTAAASVPRPQRDDVGVERPPTAINDIRGLRDSKQPNSANQMAALAAYYLSELAPEGQRSDVIDSAQLDRLFRQAGYPLPRRIGMTLSNATQAGYFDTTGETGKYRLNPVGHNLVVHSLPSGVEGAGGRRSAKKTTAKRTTAKKATGRKGTARKAAAKKGSARKATVKKATAKKP